MQSVQDYYDQLASNYDQNRFANSYGQYIDRMERQILTTWLTDTPAAQVIDMGCGTGRLLDFALTGVDASTEMLKVAALNTRFTTCNKVLYRTPTCPTKPLRQPFVFTCSCI